MKKELDSIFGAHVKPAAVDREFDLSDETIPEYPCGWPEPTIETDDETGERYVEWEVADMTGEEAAAIGYALMKLGLEAMAKCPT